MADEQYIKLTPLFFSQSHSNKEFKLKTCKLLALSRYLIFDISAIW